MKQYYVIIAMLKGSAQFCWAPDQCGAVMVASRGYGTSSTLFHTQETAAAAMDLLPHGVARIAKIVPVSIDSGLF